MADREIKMSEGKDEGSVEWERQTLTFYEDKSLNEFWKSTRNKPFKLNSGPTPIVMGDKIAYTLDCVIGKNRPGAKSSPTNETPHS